MVDDIQLQAALAALVGGHPPALQVVLPAGHLAQA